jgi:hypothetical protein
MNTKFIITTGVSILAVVATAQSPKTVTLRAPGTKGGPYTYKSALKGRESVDLKVSVAAGQTLSVGLNASNDATYFNILSPDSSEAMFIGSTSGNRAARRAPIEGNYVIRVYLMPSSARRGEKSTFTIRANVTGMPIVADTAVTKGKAQFSAKATVPCSLDLFKDVTSCPAGVIRRGGGSATLVFSPKGQTRRVLIVDGKPVAWDTTGPVTLWKSGEKLIVKFGEDQFTVDSTFISG